MNNIWSNNERYDDAIYEYLGTSFDNTFYSTVLKYFLQSLSANTIQDKKDKKLYEPAVIVDRDTIVQLYVLTYQYIKYPLFNPEILQKYNNPSKILCHMIPGSYDIITKLGGTFEPITEEYIKECIESWEKEHNVSITEYIDSLIPYMEISNNIINNRYSSIIMNFSKYGQQERYDGDELRPPYCMGLYEIFEFYQKTVLKGHDNKLTKTIDSLLETKDVAEYILNSLMNYNDSLQEQYGEYTSFGVLMEYVSCIKTDFFDTNSIVITIDQWWDGNIDSLAYIALTPTTDGFNITFNFKLYPCDNYTKESYYKDKIKITSGKSEVYDLIDRHIIEPFISNFEKEYIDKIGTEIEENEYDDIISAIVGVHNTKPSKLTDSDIKCSNNKLEKELTPTEIFDKYYNEAIQNGLVSDSAIDYAKEKSKEYFDSSKNQ